MVSTHVALPSTFNLPFMSLIAAGQLPPAFLHMARSAKAGRRHSAEQGCSKGCSKVTRGTSWFSKVNCGKGGAQKLGAGTACQCVCVCVFVYVLPCNTPGFSASAIPGNALSCQAKRRWSSRTEACERNRN